MTIVVSLLCSSVAEVYYHFSPADTPGAIIPIRIEHDYFRHVLLRRLQYLHPPPSCKYALHCAIVRTRSANDYASLLGLAGHDFVQYALLCRAL